MSIGELGLNQVSAGIFNATQLELFHFIYNHDTTFLTIQRFLVARKKACGLTRGRDRGRMSILLMHSLPSAEFNL